MTTREELVKAVEDAEVATKSAWHVAAVAWDAASYAEAKWAALKSALDDLKAYDTENT